MRRRPIGTTDQHATTPVPFFRTHAIKTAPELLDQLSGIRDQRFAVRNAVAERINAELAPTIRVTIMQYGNGDAYRQMLETKLKGAGIRQGVVAQKIAASMAPAELTAVIRSRDSGPLIDRAELNSEQATKTANCLNDPEFLFTLETVELDDQPLIELKDGQEYKDTSSLSTGQKCTTILPILLMESDSTLIVDQPEDNLDKVFTVEPTDVRAALAIFEFSQKIQEIWRGSKMLEKRRILEVVSLNRVLGDVTLELEKRKPFDELAKRPPIQLSRDGGI